jgi:4-hydroxybenzoyl-CoA thioesterase
MSPSGPTAPSPARRSFARDYAVRFGEIDHAGVMYYPALFDRIHRVFEDFWEEALGRSYARILDHDRVGFPLVDVHAAFKKPYRFGDTLRAEVAVLRIGQRSVTFRVRLRGGGDQPDAAPRAEAELSTGVVDMGSFRPMPLPEEYRRVLEDYRVEEAEGADR